MAFLLSEEFLCEYLNETLEPFMLVFMYKTLHFTIISQVLFILILAEHILEKVVIKQGYEELYMVVGLFIEFLFSS